MPVVALDSTNPFFTRREADWSFMRDSFAGERYMKEATTKYLAPTATMVHDGLGIGAPGLAAYEAYLSRAVYHNLVKPALEAMLGVMHRKSPEIELPEKLDGLRKRATFGGETLEWLIQKVNEHQLLLGRIGLMLDIATGAPANALPYVVTYETEKIVNWDSTVITEGKGERRIKFVVLNESGQERSSGSMLWRPRDRYRVLARAGDVKDIWPDLNFPDDTYVVAEAVDKRSVTDSEFKAPSLAGRTLPAVPFVFAGPRDHVPEPDLPVLEPMARIALAIYRTEADYRQALFMQGQDTLVVIGNTAGQQPGQQQQVGAFGSINLPQGGEAYYIGADSGGIDDMRKAIDSDFQRADALGAQLLTQKSQAAEAGNALSIRVAAKTATLTTVAQSGGAAVEQILKAAAVMVGADPDKVKVGPNLDFKDDAAQAQDLTYLMTSKTLGAPLSKKSIHGWLREREFTTMEYEEEMAAIDEEPPMLAAPGDGTQRGVPGNPGSQSGTNNQNRRPGQPLRVGGQRTARPGN